MKNIITERLATIGLLTILVLVIVFHLLILFGIIPFDIVWGGRITDNNQMLTFELISLCINIIMLAVVAIKARIIKVNIHPTVIKAAIWVMVGLFLLNTIGNIASLNQFERLVFTPLTILLSLFSLRLAVSGR